MSEGTRAWACLSLARTGLLVGGLVLALASGFGIHYLKTGVVVHYPVEERDIVHTLLPLAGLGLAATLLAAWMGRVGEKPGLWIAAGIAFNLSALAILVILKVVIP